MEVISNFFLYLTCVLMYYNSLFNMPKISQLLEFIKQDWSEKKNMKEFEIMKKYAEDGRTYSLIIIILTYGLIFSAMSVPAVPYILDIYFPLNQTRFHTLPFSVELFMDTDKHYCLALFIIFFASSLSCLVVVGNYTLFAVLVYHICGMFCVVRNMLDDVIDITKVYIRDRNTEDKIYAKIVRSIKYHKKTLEFDSIFNSSFEQSLSILIVLGSIIIIITFIRLLQNIEFEHENIRETISSVLNIVVNCGILSMKCHLGQKIIDHSVLIFDKAFDIPWYMLSKKSQMLLYFMMMRSLKPCYFLLANFFILSIKLSMSIIQTTLSYAMVIYSLQ
ncbi:odorant receptor 4-like [Vespa velutina]|uniref:odorant receptor 4-like n=1 Tax=Vespa velutina TaxID=202808 RepID=UPI001FB30E0A|nr:odorant receptor 4-like [Vespa velutina]